MSGIIGQGSKSGVIGGATSGMILGITHVSGPTTTGESVGASFEYIDGKGVDYVVKNQKAIIKVEWNMHLQTNTKTGTYGIVLELRHNVDSFGTALRGAPTGSGSQHIHYGANSALTDPIYIQYIAPVVGIHNHNQPAGTTIQYQMWGKGSPNGNYSFYSWDTWGDDEQVESVIFTEYMP